MSLSIKDPMSRYEMKKKEAELWAKESRQDLENIERVSVISKVKRLLMRIFLK